MQINLEIDRTRLEDEMAIQPGTYSYLAEQWAIAEQEKANKKSEIDQKKGALDLALRSGRIPMPEGIKPTEGAYRARIDSDNDIAKLVEEYNELVQLTNRAKGLMDASAQKKSMLVKLAEMTIMDYHSNADPGRAAKGLKNGY